MVLAGISTIVIWAVWWIHFRGRREGRILPDSRFPLELLGLALITLTGHLGGFLSGVNGAN
jgi:hypothetical protein